MRCLNVVENWKLDNLYAYQGSTTKIDEHNLKKFGQSSAIVLELLKILKKEGHSIF